MNDAFIKFAKRHYNIKLWLIRKRNF
jgi:hypothetical protein